MVDPGYWKALQRTFLSQPPPLVSLQLLRAAFARNGSITSRLRIVQYHRLLEKFKPVHFINGPGGSIDAVKDDECLALGPQVGFRDDLEHISKLGEDFLERFLQLVDLDAFF